MPCPLPNRHVQTVDNAACSIGLSYKSASNRNNKQIKMVMHSDDWKEFKTVKQAAEFKTVPVCSIAVVQEPEQSTMSCHATSNLHAGDEAGREKWRAY